MPEINPSADTNTFSNNIHSGTIHYYEVSIKLQPLIFPPNSVVIMYIEVVRILWDTKVGLLKAS
jgi:hypothetical protein